MGALRRPERWEVPEPPERRADAEPAPETHRYPRWAVVSGVVVYCLIFWVAVWGVGSGALQMLTAAASGR